MQSIKKETLLILGAFSIIYIIAYSPLLVNSTPFADDIIRQYWGQNNNIRVGRPLIELLADVVHWFGFVTDLRPTSQLVAILLLSLCSYALVENFSVKNASTLQKILAGSLVGLPPFFLGNMAYSFDAPFMALSLLLSTLAAISVKKITLSGGALSFFFLCCSLCLYQPAIAAFVALVCFNGIRRIEEPSKAILYCVKCAAILASALVIYLICFKMFMAGDKHDYSTVHSALAVDASSVQDFVVRVAKFLRGKYFAGWIKYPVFVILIMAIAAATRCRGALPKLMAVCFIGLMFVSPFLIQIALQNSVLELRSVYGFGVVLALAALLAFEMSLSKSVVPLCVCLIAVWGSSMVGAFSSALKLQRDYDLAILRSSIDRVWSVFGGPPRSISLKGDAGYQSYAYTAYVKYPQLRGMIAPILGNAWLMPAIGTSINFDGLKVVGNIDGELVAVGFKYKIFQSDKEFFIEYAY